MKGVNLDESRRFSLSQVKTKTLHKWQVMFLTWAAAGGYPMATVDRSVLIGRGAPRGHYRRRGYSYLLSVEMEHYF